MHSTATDDIKVFIEQQKRSLKEEKVRLAVKQTDRKNEKICDKLLQQQQHQQQLLNNNHENVQENKENSPLSYFALPPVNKKLKQHTVPLIGGNDLLSSVGNEGGKVVGERTQALINNIVNSDNPLSFRSDVTPGAMLRFGEYSPNNPQVRVSGAAPYLGLGEYEQRKNYFLQKRKAEYLEHLSQKSREVKLVFNEERALLVSKAVQTDIQNIHAELIQHDLSSQWLNGRTDPKGYDKIDTSSNSYINNAQNALLKADMDKPKSILSNRRTGSPRERLLSEMKQQQQQHNYTPSFMDGFSYQDRSEELERERLKRETYQNELRLQIEEKRRMQIMREEQERREQELENRRLEQQLLRMQEEQLVEEQRRNRKDEQMRRHSEDLIRRKCEAQRGYRKHTESESSGYGNSTNVASKALPHYSPPVSRRNPYSYSVPSTSVFSEPPSTGRYNHHHLSPSSSRYDSYLRKDTLNRMDSLYDYNTSQHFKYNRCNRYDSLSRIDSLNHQDMLNRLETLNLEDSYNNTIQRRHSATHQDLSLLRKSPKLQRRSSSSRFEDSLPIPVLKAHSPVARELKNSVPFNSTRHSDALRKLEDKWQIPAVQKNILNHEMLRDGGSNRNILTQLGAIRMQLQQEQVRMDETLRKRGITQSKAVDFH